MSTRNIPGGKGGRCVRLTTYHHTAPLSRNLGALTSQNPQGLFMLTTGQLYLLSSYMRSVVDRNVVRRRMTVSPLWCYSTFVVSPNPVFSASTWLSDVKLDLRFSRWCSWRRQFCCVLSQWSWHAVTHVSYKVTGVFNFVGPEGAGNRLHRQAYSCTPLYRASYPRRLKSTM